MKALSTQISAAGLTFAALAASAPVPAQTTLTISSFVPQQHLITRSMTTWAQEIEKASNGRIKHSLLPKAVVAGPGTFDAVQEGLADVSFVVHGYTPGRFVLTKVTEFPLLGTQAEVISAAYARVYEKHLHKAGEHQGVEVLSVFSQGPGQIYTTKKAVKSIKDLAGMKFRVGGGIAADIAGPLGFIALIKPAPETYEMLSQGVADGVLFSGEGVAGYKLDKLVKYATFVPGGLYNTSFVMIMNSARYNKLEPQDKKVIDGFRGEKLARHIGRFWDEGDKLGTSVLKASGAQIINADDAFVKALQERTRPVEQAWNKEAQGKGVDGAKVLSEFRSEIRSLSNRK